MILTPLTKYKIKIMSVIVSLTVSGLVMLYHSMSIPCCWRTEFILTGPVGAILMISGLFVSIWGAINTLSSQSDYSHAQRSRNQ